MRIPARIGFRPGFLLGLVVVIAALGSCARAGEPQSAAEQLLGTIVRLSVHDADFDKALFDRVFERTLEIEQRMSTTEIDYDTSELLELNRAAGVQPMPVSPDTLAVLDRAVFYSELTAGAFDVTIWPLVRLWGIGTDEQRIPSAESIASAMGLMGVSDLELNAQAGTAFLARTGMGVDVGAIAKGYAADQARDILEAGGVSHALLDFGGNILVIGTKPDGSPWRIGVQRPDGDRSAFIGIVEAVDQTVVTSGTYERYFESDGVRYHHILDAATGYPANSGLTQVTIVARSSMDADALSTSLFVMGLRDGLALVERLADVEAIFVDQDRDVWPSSGIAGSFRLTDSDFTLRD